VVKHAVDDPPDELGLRIGKVLAVVAVPRGRFSLECGMSPGGRRVATRRIVERESLHPGAFALCGDVGVMRAKAVLPAHRPLRSASVA
jgi:hypothetical protein